jgi:Mg-chelatase subunit ChlD
MRNESSDWTVHEVRRHILAAFTACVLSLGVHLAVLILVPAVVIRAPAQQKEREKQWPSFKLADVTERATEPPDRRMSGIGDPKAVGRTPGVVELRQPLDPARLQPVPVTGISGVSETKPLVKTSEPPKPNFWQPRQELLAVQRRVVPDSVALLPRRLLPPVERIPEAEDVVSPFDRSALISLVKGESFDLSMTSPRTGVGLEWAPVTGGRKEIEKVGAGTEAPRIEDVAAEKKEEITRSKPIEDFLSVDVTVFRSARDPDNKYFRLDVRRRGADVLPVMPKNVLLVVDSSASMTEQKLYFCREGLLRCLDAIKPPDLFNVMAFNDRGMFCFDTWTEPSAVRMAEARRFILGLKAEGNTDVFASIRDLPDRLVAGSDRPAIAILVTDGHPTTGLMDSSSIIGEFSKRNSGRMSVFTFGTSQTANSYLLDLLGYCNRGEGFVLRSGRWDIPGAIADWMKQTARPVLSDVRFVLPADSPCEVFPVQTANMYLDRSLVLFGRCPASTSRVLFQAAGRGRDNECDMIYTARLDGRVSQGGQDLRASWARQKIYHLIGQYARRADPAILREIRATAREYNVEIPHTGQF